MRKQEEGDYQIKKSMLFFSPFFAFFSRGIYIYLSLSLPLPVYLYLPLCA
jgi:hypothetical protein